MAVVRDLTTFQKYLNDRKWWFYEQGGIAIYNELAAFAADAIAGAGSAMPTGKATFGVCLLATNINPAFVERANATGQTDVSGNVINPPTQTN